MRHTLPRAVTVLSAVAALAAGGVVAAGSATAAPGPSTASQTSGGWAKYVALGDSYSSGESVTPYGWNSDTAINHCHRSQLAYPALISKTWGLNSFDFAACSGAITSDLYNPNHSGNQVTVDVLEPAQLSHLGPSTKLVTLTIGGNDVGFSQIMGACLYNDQQRATRTDCSTGPIKALVDARIAALDGVANGATTPGGAVITPVAQVLADIRTRAPQAAVEIGTYPQLVAKDFAGTECRVGALGVVEAPGQQVPLYVSKTDAQWMNTAIDQLDAVIKRATSTTGMTTVAEARTTFAGHAHCDTGTSFITPVSGTVSVRTGAVSIDAGSMHPTAAGQLAYYAAFTLAR